MPKKVPTLKINNSIILKSFSVFFFKAERKILIFFKYMCFIFFGCLVQKIKCCKVRLPQKNTILKASRVFDEMKSQHQNVQKSQNMQTCEGF